MKSDCTEFRAALEEALAGPEQRRVQLSRHPHPARCAICRAELEREQKLERALDAVPVPKMPPDLVHGLQARLETMRGAPDELDGLLARVPAPRVPPQLAETVLDRLATERPARRRRLGLVWLAAAAAAALLAWAWLARRAEPDEIREELARAAVVLDADEELLVYALERWELLHDEDLDLWLASLDRVDQYLMEVAEGEPWLDLSETAEGD